MNKCREEVTLTCIHVSYCCIYCCHGILKDFKLHVQYLQVSGCHSHFLCLPGYKKNTVKFSLDEVKSWSLIIYPSVCLGNHFQESCLESYYSKVDFLKSRSKIQTWLSTKSHPWEAELSHNALWLNYIYSIMYSGKAY